MIKNETLITQYLSEIISGFTISILLIPESIAFSYILGLPAIAGIQSTMIHSFMTAFFGGTPGLISGSTAAVATSLFFVGSLLGKEYIFLTVIFGGIIQLLMSATGLYKYIFDIPKSVASGFLVALAVLIAYSQLQNFKTGSGWLTGDPLYYTLILSAISLLITVFGFIVLKFKYISKNNINFPGGLVSIIALTTMTYFFHNMLPIQTVKDKGDFTGTLPTLHIPNVEWTLQNIATVLPFSMAMALSGLTESLFMVKDGSRILGIPENPLRESIVQGISNIMSGFTGSIGGCILVGQSKFNYENGSRTRISAMATSLFFIIFALFFETSIQSIPIPAIVGIMMAIAFKTGDWHSLFAKMDKEWLTTVFTALVGIGSSSLSLGVILGSLFHSLV